MQVTDRSLTNRARRDQITAAAIAVLADEGYAAATFRRIAARAGLPSTRSLSYHFDDKDELVAAVLERLFATIGAFVGKHVVDHPDAASALAGYVRTTVALNDTHRAEMRALMRVFLDHRPRDGSRPYTGAEEDTAVGRVQRLLQDGQDAGLFRPFDTWVMATTIQRSLDGLPFLLEQRPDLDLAHYADELVTTVDRATRR